MYVYSVLISPDISVILLFGISYDFFIFLANVIVDKLKKAEDSEHLVLRVYEWFNRGTECTIDLGFDVLHGIECDLMENDIADAIIEDNVLKFSIKPYEIKTFKLL